MIHHTLGTWEINIRRPQESIGYLLKAFELHPREDSDRGQIHETYASALFDLGRTAKRSKSLNRPLPREDERLRSSTTQNFVPRGEA